VEHLLRVTKPGRNCCVHIQDVVSTKATHGVRGIQDFTSPVIQLFSEVGFTYYSRIAIDKNPQMQAARNKVHELMFATKKRDALSLAPVMLEYLLVFKAPGENAVPVHDPIDNNTWIEWAHGLWPADGRPMSRSKFNSDEMTEEDEAPMLRTAWCDIRETDVLNTAIARDNNDERHMCPLQLPLIERCIKLWSNEGEVVLSPFAGIGSEIVMAVRTGRKGIGIELKPSYFQTAVQNVRKAESETKTLDLFSEVE
jgi:DNA modification methylase